MTSKEKEVLKNKILVNYESHNKIQGSKFKRIINNPYQAIYYFMMQSFAYLRPYNTKIKTFWGNDLSVCLPEAGTMYYYGFLEVNLTNFFINFFQDGDIFFDVGSHVGYYSSLVSTLVGPSGSVHAFEPTLRTFKILKENTKNIKNVSIYNVAVLNKDSEIDFFDYGARHSVFNSFERRTSEGVYFKDDATKLRVKTVSLNNFCKEKSIIPDFIKIDTEGSEFLILEEMNYLLENFYPIITIEISNCEEWKENCLKSMNILLNKGYECYRISLEGNLKKYTSKELCNFDNLLFVHPKKSLRIKSLVI